MIDFEKLFKSFVSDDAPTHTYKGFRYTVTVSNNPHKIMVVDNFTDEEKRFTDLNSLELSLLALIAALAERRACEYTES